MNELESEFLNASIEFSEHEAEEREAQHQRELEAARQLAESERQRAEVESRRAEEQVRNAGQLRRRAIYLVGVLALAIVAALMAGIFANRNAVNYQAAGPTCSAEANSLMRSNGDPNLIAAEHSIIDLQYTSAGDAMCQPDRLELRRVSSVDTQISSGT
jgi:hypothetical protein